MLGAIAGDIIGSAHERSPTKHKAFALFSPGSRLTDDSVLSLAIAHALLEDRDYRHWVWTYARRYPEAGYGASFRHWVQTDGARPYNSWGNGAAMRVAAIGHAFDTPERVLQEAADSAAITHNHPEGIKGAQAVALCVYLARQGAGKAAIREDIARRFGYSLSRSLETIRPMVRFDVSCQGSVPEAIIAFLDATGYEDAVRNAVSLGGDSDTQACIAGAIAEAFYGGVEPHIEKTVLTHFLPEPLSAVLRRFRQRFPLPDPRPGR
jgi:ADP-ribosylglycohydrolase